MKKAVMLGLIAGLAIGLTAHKAEAQMSPQMNEQPVEQTGQFRKIDQPLSHKLAVTIGGLGLIGLELWWFLLSKPKSRQATAKGGIQQVTVTVDGGYEPSYIVVKAGQPVKLNFDRKDPSSCLEEVRFPDFQIAQTLPLNQTTAIEFTPEQPGNYTFTCGMNMFRGVIEVQPAESAPVEPATSRSTPAAAQSVQSE